MRKLGVLLAAGVLLFSAASCTTKKAVDVSAGSSTTEARGSDEGGGTTTSTRRTTTTESQSDSGDSSEIPGLGDLGDCLEVSLAYASLFIGATFATDDQKDELEQQLGDIKAKVPADIRDDMDVISQGMADADGIAQLGEFLDSDAFKDANANIEQYFEESCGTADGGSGN